MRLAGWMVCLSLLIGLAAGAAEKTEALLEKASTSYADLDFEGALKLLQQAVGVERNTRAQLVRIYHLTGLCLGALQRYDEARQSFARLLALDPTYRLGTDVSPRVRAPFDQLVGQNPRRLKVRVLPPPYARKGKPLVITFQVDSDSLGMGKRFRIWFRRGSTGSYSSVQAPITGEGEHRVRIPAPAWEGQKKTGPISWYAAVEGEHQSLLHNFGDSLHPYNLEVTEQKAKVAAADQSAWYQKWWVWALVGGVAVAATTTAAVLGSSGTPQGPFDFSVDFSTSR